MEKLSLSWLERRRAVLGEEIDDSSNQKPVPTPSLYRYDDAHPVPGIL